MERESFENEEVAALLNRSFVAVKVDREERPDIDAVYMEVCQAMTGTGGWPLTILMTPDKKPFFAGTYLPRHSARGALGLTELLQRAAHLWESDRSALLKTGEEIAQAIAQPEEAAASAPEKRLLAESVRQYARAFDERFGGFGTAPKFPAAHNLLFLLRYSELTGDVHARRMAERTLEGMARGGMFDQIGGGFSRYSTDDRWLVPHFEKMLYDNALLSYAYLEAFRLTGRRLYRAAAERTIGYVLCELRHPEGGFFCGQDADSDGVEGKYYVFTPQEVESVLGAEDAAYFCAWFDIAPQGNFEGKSIPNLLKNPGYEAEEARIAPLRKKLYEYRLQRTALHLDDKILTAWNALMLAALAKAYRVLGDERCLEAARKNHTFIKTHLKTPEGRLFARWREGEAAHMGTLDDYAFYLWALLELYGADFDVEYLQEAKEIAGLMRALFYDEGAGGFFLYACDAEQLIARPKAFYDGAMPSGNSAAALALGRLFRLTGEAQWGALSDKQLACAAGWAAEYPMGHAFALLALSEELYPAGELVCTANDLTREAPAVRALAERRHLTALVKTAQNAEQLAQAAPFTAAYPLPAHGSAYYLCRNGACAAPVYTLEALEALLQS